MGKFISYTDKKLRLGYTGNNLYLSETSGIMTNRKIALYGKTPDLVAISELALANVKDLQKIIFYNSDNKINFYRISSDLFPHWIKYDFRSLKDWDEIEKLLKDIGAFARKENQRLTFHPNHYVVLGSHKPYVRLNARKDLEKHSELLDIMGFEPSLWNKLNIHVGSAEGGKEDMMECWVKSFNKLSENCRKRIAIENDDKESMYSVVDLYKGIHKKTGVPITFDTLHHEVGNHGGLSKMDAAGLAESTWPKDLFVIHHSSRKKLYEDSNARYNSHADYIYETIETYNTDAWVMLESKAKEKALLEYELVGHRHKTEIIKS